MASSQIPVISHRPALGLVSPPRYPSVSSSPTVPSAASAAPTTPFRSFRNFLSFGTSKHTPSSSTPSAIPKSHLNTVGPVRRSVQVERRASSPQLALRRSDDEYVLSIDLARPGDERSPSPASLPVLPPSELSTIIESDTSGISKHLPSLDTSRTRSQSPEPQALHPPHRDSRHASPSPSIDTSVLDFSTSKLTSQVLAALSQSGGNDDWLHSVVVDDVPPDSSTGPHQVSDTSFHLSSLDPDLAALLSPNRIKEPALLVATDAIPLPTSTFPHSPPFDKSPSVSTPTAASFAGRRQPAASLSAAPHLPPSSLPRITRSVSDRPVFTTSGPPSPVARTPSPRAASPERPSPITSTPQTRLQRTTPVSSVRRPGSSAERKPAATRLMTPARPSSSSAATSSRPLLSRLNSTPTASTWDSNVASPVSRPPSALGTAASRLQQSSHRPSLDTERPRLAGSVRTRKRSTSVIERRVTAGSPQPPPPSSSRMADWLGPRTAKAFAAAGLLDFDRDAAPSPGSASRPPSRFGTARSSVERDARARYTPSRMAFSEAGSSSSWGARSGSISRAAGYSPETAGAPSEATLSTPRTAFSTASTAATSVSAASSSAVQHMQTELQQQQERHAVETGALLSALADSQRTTRLLRDENGELRDRIQMLEDKLADAQERIQQILLYSHSHTYAHQQQQQQQNAAAHPAKALYSKRYGSPASSSGRRSLSHSRPSSFLGLQHARGADGGEGLLSSPEPGGASPETPVDLAGFAMPGWKRVSATSSMFASLPSNMSMLLHEDGGVGVGVSPPDAFAALSMSPPGSPTMVFARVQSGVQHHHKPSSSSRGGGGALSHRANRSMSSAGNVSPTTAASFSMMTGSPGSLNLRPEHEMHLGDMSPLDLDADELEFDSAALR